MTSSRFTIRTIEELAAATYSVGNRESNRYIFGGATRAGEFLVCQLSFDTVDEDGIHVVADLAGIFTTGMVIVEADDDMLALTRAVNAAEIVEPALLVATLVGDDLRLNGKVYRMEELTFALPEAVRPIITPLSLWEESRVERFDPVEPVDHDLTDDETVDVLRRLIEVAESGEVPDAELVAKVGSLCRTVRGRDRVFTVALGAAPEERDDVKGERFTQAMNDPDVKFNVEDAWRPLLIFIGQHLTGGAAAHAWANAGAYAWVTGRSRLAERCAQRSQSIDPENSFAELISTAVTNRYLPQHVKSRLGEN